MSQPYPLSRMRPVVACIGLAVCFTVFSGRLVQLHVTKHETYADMAARKNLKKEAIHARRGSVRDINGETLAVSEPLRTVVADGSRIRDPKKAAEVLAPFLEMEANELEEKLKTDRRYVVLKRKVPEVTAQAMRSKIFEERIRGIQTEPDWRRIYPNGSMLCHVLGFLNYDQIGVEGVERTLESYLRGRDGFRVIERSSRGEEIVPYRRHERDPRDGYNVRLTIDMAIQGFVEAELDAAVREYQPEMATVIVMDPKTGRILALANRPHFDPNQPGEGEAAGKKNAAIISQVEPGSTFKIVTVAAAYNEGDVTPATVLNLEGGRFHFAGRILKDHGRGPFPNRSVHDVLVKSSNIGVAKLAMMMGERRFYEYLRSFGFGERTGVNLPGEIAGVLHAPRWSKISISRIPMGQGVATTPIQMVAAVSAAVNGGNLMLPQIVRDVTDDEGKTLVNFDPVVVRRVIEPEVTGLVMQALGDVVSPRGTARNAAIPGYTAGGKTGTAQKPNPAGGYYKNRYVSSFIGCMPLEDPKFVCLVLFDDAKVPSNQNYGGILAAPVFSRIAEKTARYWNLPPNPELLGKDGIKLTQSLER